MTAVLSRPTVNFAQHDLQIGERVRILPGQPMPPGGLTLPQLKLLEGLGTAGVITDVHHDGTAWIISVLLDGQEWALPYTLADLVRER